MIVWVFLAECLDGGAKISAPFVGGCFFHLAEKEESDDGGPEVDAEVFELSGFGIDGVVVGLDLALEVEGCVENLECLGESVVIGGVVGALADGLE